MAFASKLRYLAGLQGLVVKHSNDIFFFEKKEEEAERKVVAYCSADNMTLFVICEFSFGRERERERESTLKVFKCRFEETCLAGRKKDRIYDST